MNASEFISFYDFDGFESSEFFLIIFFVDEVRPVFVKGMIGAGEMESKLGFIIFLS